MGLSTVEKKAFDLVAKQVDKAEKALNIIAKKADKLEEIINKLVCGIDIIAREVDSQKKSKCCNKKNDTNPHVGKIVIDNYGEGIKVINQCLILFNGTRYKVVGAYVGKTKVSIKEALANNGELLIDKTWRDKKNG